MHYFYRLIALANYNNNLMKQRSIKSSMIPNIFELDELPFLKRQISQWQRFKNKQKFMPTLRNLTYQCNDIFSKVFLFSFTQEIKEKKKLKYLHILTQREIITLEQYYQILNENIEQKEFSREVDRIKIFQKDVYNYTQDFLGKNLIRFNSNPNYLEFNIYKNKDQFYLKATFNNYNYQLEFTQNQKVHSKPQPFKIMSSMVKQHLNQRFSQLQSILYSLPFNHEIALLYKTFYDDVYFLYDQFILKLQVFHNYPILRLKTFVPVKFTDFKTHQPLEGPIFSSANPECMFGHFHGYNADTIKMVEGEHCQSCQFFIQQLQQNQLLMMMRDNVFNPSKSDIFYCPEYNRFKLLTKAPITVESNQGEICQQKVIYRTTLKYLNYYHFKTNLKKITNKMRLTFDACSKQQEFPLTFTLLNRKIPIIDPARGRYCRHFAFTDLRLYYLGYNQEDNTYSCPIPGCTQVMTDSDILYLKEVAVLIEYAKFKCQECPQLIQTSKVFIDNSKKKLFVSYRVRQNGTFVSKLDELIDFYKTLADPYIPFPEYSLGIKDKQRRAKIDQYMFGGLRQQMKQQEQIQEEEEDEYEAN